MGFFQLFRLELHLSSFNPSVSFADIMDYDAVLTFWQGSAALWHFAYEVNLTPQSQTLRDYTFTNPRYNLEQSSLAQGQNVLGEQSAVNSAGVL